MANITGVDPPVLNDTDYVDKIYDSFIAIDNHDHTSTKGVAIPTGGLSANAVTNAKLATMAQSTIKGRASGAGTGDPTDLTATQATAILNNFVGDSGSGGTKGLVPAPSAGDAASAKVLRADGNWATVPSGGGNLTWWNDDGTAPLQETKYNNKCWGFEDGLSQNLYGVIKVPATYNPGSQIRLRLFHFHEAASATQLISSQSTLLSSGSAFDSTTNQRTSTNAASAGGNKVLVLATLDLTDSSGQINGVAVAANDLIRIRLFRGTDASTSDVFFIESSAEVSFS